MLYDRPLYQLVDYVTTPVPEHLQKKGQCLLGRVFRQVSTNLVQQLAFLGPIGIRGHRPMPIQKDEALPFIHYRP